MRQYLGIVKDILENGLPRPNRTGERGIGKFGYTFHHDLRNGFPLLTTKHMNPEPIWAELIGFIKGVSSAAYFRHLGTKIWDANANDPGKPGSPNAWLDSPFRKGADDLGRIYGVQWNAWDSIKIVPENADPQVITALESMGYESVGYVPAHTGADHGDDIYRKSINQLDNLIAGIKRDPFGRRHIVTAWNPGELAEMALPPCHDFFQVYVVGDETGKPVGLDLFCHMRSVDVFLGMPFNIASYATLAHMIAHVTGLEARMLSFFFGDTHIYESHIPEMLMQVRREPKELCDIEIGVLKLLPKDAPRMWSGAEDTTYWSHAIPADAGESAQDHADRVEAMGGWNAPSPFKTLRDFTPESFRIVRYQSHGPLKGKMAV